MKKLLKSALKKSKRLLISHFNIGERTRESGQLREDVNPRYAELVSAGNQAISANDWASAVLYLQRIMKDFPSNMRESTYVCLAKSYWKTGRTSDAEVTLQAALVRYPGSAELMTARQQLMGNLEFGPDSGLSPCIETVSSVRAEGVNPYLQRVREHLRQGNLDLAEEAAKQGFEHSPMNVALMGEYAKIYRNRGDWEEFGRITFWTTPFSAAITLPQSPPKISTDDMAEQAFSLLRKQMYRESIDSFDQFLSASIIPDQAKPLWRATFLSLESYYRDPGGREHRKDIESLRGLKAESSVRKVFVSGFGWSGSGAVFDYFREFSNVKSISWEFKFAESRYGLNALKKSINDKNVVPRVKLADFFQKAMLGAMITKDWGDIASVWSARRMVYSDHAVEYAQSVHDLCEAFVELSKTKSLNEETFCQITKVFFDRLLLALGNFPGSVYLLDNWVHAGGLAATKFFSNAHFFVVTRDPRTQYVANFNENAKFHKDVDKFIETYQTSLEQCLTVLKESNAVSSCVTMVKFEDFVLSEECRAKLAEKIGVEIGVHDKEKYFKASESKKNIFNHNTFKNKSEIKKISEKLAQYCESVAN